MHVLTLLKLMHLAGLVLGLGGAILADLMILRHGILKPIRRYTFIQIDIISKAVTVGLSLLWVSGILLVWGRVMADPEYFANPKLWAKIVIVCMLTANGVAVHFLALPRLNAQFGRCLFDRAGRRDIAILTAIGAVSTVSWFLPFILGVASELNFVTPAWQILAVYAVAVCAMWGANFTFGTHMARRSMPDYWQPRIDIARRLPSYAGHKPAVLPARLSVAGNPLFTHAKQRTAA